MYTRDQKLIAEAYFQIIRGSFLTEEMVGSLQGMEQLKAQLRQAHAGNYTAYIHFLKQNAGNAQFHTLLNSGQGQSDFVTYQESSVTVQSCIPTQNEIDVNKSLVYPLTVPEAFKNCFNNNIIINKAPILVYPLGPKNYIMDGHHRWSQVYAINPQATMAATLCKPAAKIQPIEMLKAIQTAIAATTQNVPVAEVKGTNLLNTDVNQLQRFIQETLTDSVLAVCQQMNFGNDKASVATKIIQNINLMRKTNQPIAGAPKRDVMPQTDVAGAMDKLKSITPTGKVDCIQPVAPV